MTKWQESCITALASTPLDWELFKMKQRNKQMLWQYVNRIWPYHKVKLDSVKLIESVCNKHNVLFSQLTKIRILISRRIHTQDNTVILEEYERPLIFDSDLIKLIAKKYDDILKEREKSNLNRTGNNFLRIVFKIENGESHVLRCSGARSLINALCNLYTIYNSDITITRMRLCESCNDITLRKEILLDDIDFIISTLSTLNKIKKVSSTKLLNYTYNSLNIGIEIEHNATHGTDANICKQILLHNCKSYESGYDGDCDYRLNENRIRLNGIKGLKGLFILLENMKNTCFIDTNSSVHMHIDCKYDNSFIKVRMFSKRRLLGLQTGSIKNDRLAKEYLRQVFLLKEDHEYLYDSDMCREKSDFNTLEYRYCIPNFNYSDYVLQILFLIHITECIKRACPFNINYLKLLADVAHKLRSAN